MRKLNSLLFAVPFISTLVLLQLTFSTQISRDGITFGLTLALSALLTVVLCLKLDQGFISGALSVYKRLIFFGYASLLMGMLYCGLLFRIGESAFVVSHPEFWPFLFPILFQILFCIILLTLVPSFLTFIKVLDYLFFVPQKKYSLAVYGGLLIFSTSGWVLLLLFYLFIHTSLG